jgi:hypothetical protein
VYNNLREDLNNERILKKLKDKKKLLLQSPNISSPKN